MFQGKEQMHTFCNSASIALGSDLRVVKYHLQDSRASAATGSAESTEEGRKGKTKSAGMMFDFPSERISNWMSAAISIL